MNTQPEALRLAEIGQYLEGGEKANWSIDVCAELRRLHAANVDYLEHFNALKAERDGLLAALRHLLDMTGEPPDRNCSCHISPPCNDCVDHSGWRDAFEFASAVIAKAEA